ncbi:unnamed protein product [Ilex paraguariensis]|uniref:Uncharacterized protein n=1 Tax=Ilex paraguariensis TaxID=185542 RepID=A0ABC8QLF1_9AQUA
MDPCCLDLSKPLPPLVKAFDCASELTALRGMAPVFAVWKTKRALNIGSEKRLREAIELIHGCVSEMIQRSLEGAVN